MKEIYTDLNGQEVKLNPGEYREFTPVYFSQYRLLHREPIEIRIEVLEALFEYSAFGRMPKTLSSVAKMYFDSMLPTVKSSRIHAKNRNGRTLPDYSKEKAQKESAVNMETGEVEDETPIAEPTPKNESKPVENPQPQSRPAQPIQPQNAVNYAPQTRPIQAPGYAPTPGLFGGNPNDDMPAF